MLHRWRYFTACAVLAPALLLGACDARGPEQLTGPAAAPADGPDFARVLDGGSCGQDCVEATIGREGGLVWLGSNYIWVTRNAVRRPTVFRLRLTDAGEYGRGVELTATQGRKQVHTFNRRIQLGLYYGGLPVQMHDHLFIADEFGDPVPGGIDTQGEVVTGWVWHFSQYVIASN